MKKEQQPVGPCAHKNIKFFKQKDRVICLDCGEDWNHGPAVTYYPIYQNPVIVPFTQPYYPTWSAPAEVTCTASNFVSFDRMPEGTQISNTTKQLS